MHVDRRTFLGLGGVGLAGCTRDGPYFGNTQPPSRQELICTLFAAGGSLDPAQCANFLTEGQILRALFEGMTDYHPATLEPVAGLATHYETSSDGMRVLLFLRGHPRPRGTRLPAMTDDISTVYWTDHTAVTAHDIVYSWRRAVDPETGGPCAYLLYPIQRAIDINTGRVRPEKLGVSAPDEWTLQVDLRTPTPYFLRLLSCVTLLPVPRQAVESARKRGREASWTEPGNIVTSGAFTLQQWRPRESIVLTRNPAYLGTVQLERVSFLLTNDATVGTNLYKSGEVHSMSGFVLSPTFVPALRGKKDLSSARAFGTFFPYFNVRRWPFDNVLVRYAFNMATEKPAIADVFGFGRVPARTLVPPLAGYVAPHSVDVQVGQKSYDVLSFDPRGAQELLAAAGIRNGRDALGRRVTIDLLYPTATDARLHSEILQQQWQTNLGIDVRITDQEFDVWIGNVLKGNFPGITEYGDWGYYLDPNWFLEQFTTGPPVNASGWTDAKYDVMLARANATQEPELRMSRLSECEAYLLRGMPFIPEFYDVWAYPQKPYVRGIAANAMDVHPLRFAWIDTNWRPE